MRRIKYLKFPKNISESDRFQIRVAVYHQMKLKVAISSAHPIIIVSTCLACPSANSEF